MELTARTPAGGDLVALAEWLADDFATAPPPTTATAPTRTTACARRATTATSPRRSRSSSAASA